MKIISGGQTGADRAALDAAIKMGIPHGGWLPRGRKTEDGPLPKRYALRELDSDNYKKRTEKNVTASDGTLIVAYGPLNGGTALTESLTIKHDRPCLVLDLEEISPVQAVEATRKWLMEKRISILNVAGPRASGEPRIYKAVKKLLLALDWENIEQAIEERNYG
ncbi:MAG: putative molybdenum carrier protein [Desulfobulbaceae bacterium]|nr:putative molybdenum carrier protein [Desulfobulbaceae bacterium]